MTYKIRLWQTRTLTDFVMSAIDISHGEIAGFYAISSYSDSIVVTALKILEMAAIGVSICR